MTVVDTLYALFARYGDRSYGEDVSQRDHALQVADVARADGAPDTLVVAALLHDIGQFLDREESHAADDPDEHHELSGAAFLAHHYPPAVVAPIKLHVAAKRYLCAVEPGYHATLSDASVASLSDQGGPFDPAEALAFARVPYAHDAIRLRRYDDFGKQLDREVPPLDFYRPLLTRLLL